MTCINCHITLSTITRICVLANHTDQNEVSQNWTRSSSYGKQSSEAQNEENRGNPLPVDKAASTADRGAGGWDNIDG